MSEETKICPRCGNEYPFDSEHFNWRNKNKGTRQSICKECQKSAKHKWIADNREHIKAYNKKYRADNAEWYSQYNRENAKRYRKENYDVVREKEKAYAATHRKESYARHNKRMHTDPKYHLEHTIRVAIRRAFTKSKSNKHLHTKEITGMPSKELRDYLLKTYEDIYGIPWDGNENVHIDHIIPLKTAVSSEDIIRLNHYSNLRLIKAEDNLRKGSKLNYEIKGDKYG